MAKSDSKTSNETPENHSENDDQQATTSRGAALKAGTTFDNMDDLEPIDFNSADAVRQTMKAVLGGRMPAPFAEEVNHSHSQGTSASIKINGLARGQFHPVGQYMRSLNPSRDRIRETRNRLKQRRNRSGTRYTAGPSDLKKRSTRSKGSNKKIQTLFNMYLGKLSNVVPFRRRWQSDSDSDLESTVLY